MSFFTNDNQSNDNQQAAPEAQQQQANPFGGGAPAPAMVNPFAGVPGADPTGDGTKYLPGTYASKITGTEITTSKSVGCPLFIVETEVVEKVGSEGNEAGETPSQTIFFNNQAANANAQVFFVAAFKALAEKMGKDAEFINGVEARMKANPQQQAGMMQQAVQQGMLLGLVLKLETTQKTSQAGRDYIRHNWSYVPGWNKPAAG